ncbi:hypothetical protein HAHE_20580 [Haloferula helveola]|uniref:HicB family protein n=1 Tax=Haloferula helveola TaxID=490095 RepID=A0ABN6H3B8_9BACT|nr:hypothetical protein HAHE_20580 [Haloferula helveola]
MDSQKNFVENSLTVSVMPRGSDGYFCFVAQCHEYDICVQGSSLDECQSRFVTAVEGHIALAISMGRTPFADLPAPPAEILAELTGRVPTQASSRPIGRRAATGVDLQNLGGRATFAIA